MREAGKWNYQKKEYDKYELPTQGCKTIAFNMDEPVDCAQCGKEMKFGNGYTSKEIHTEFGFGFTVCENCYNDEREREKEAELWRY